MAASSSSSSSPRWNYDVFLSFRGEDTRKNFVDHLYMALHQKGIYTFKDDEKLKRGKSISPELLKAIKESRIAVIVFSENYASSSWCLDELVEIIQCKNIVGQTVLPVFYNVDPSQVRNQKRSFAEAFGEHEETFGKENDKVQRWRAALKEAANLSGWNLETTENGHEAKFIQKIVGETLKVLGRLPFNVAKYEVGIDCRVDKVITLLDSGLKEVRIVGICGIGGLGKTTIAKAVFNQIFDQFESCHFLGNVREESKKHGLPYLQQQLLKGILKEEDLWIRDVDYRINVIKQRLCHKKVLVVLDDVDDVMQLKSLAGGNDWFGFGSRIIVTTRNERLLVDNKVDHVIYRVEGLNHDEALQLFSRHAFNQNHPKEDYLKLSHSIKDYAKGLPLALEVLGSLLFGRSIKEWEHELDNLKSIPNMEIHDVLKRSYDGLNDTEKDLFLDIACFFKGNDKDYVMDILSSTGFHPRIRVLIERSLITISNWNELLMHDLIEEMGKEIVRQESPDDPGKRSRLWFYEDIYKVLEDNMATKSIKGIMLKWPHDHTVEELHINVDAFVKMKRLKFLNLSGAVRVCGPISYLSNELCYFDWDGCPISFLPSNFRPRNLVHLNLPRSQIEQICFPVKLEHLKFLNLSESPYLNKTLDLSCFPCLENLDLNKCRNLVEVQLFSGVHERLVEVNLRGCKNLRSLPKSIKLKKLKIFDLSNCSKLEKFPDIQEGMDCLHHLNLEGTAITELPLSMEHLSGLRYLYLHRCQKLKIVPSNIFAKMKDLSSIEMRGTAVKELPSSIVHLSALKIFNLSDFQGGPTSLMPFALFMGQRSNSTYQQLEVVSHLGNLSQLDLSNCNLSEEFFPNDIGGLSSLYFLNLSGNNFISIPESIGSLSSLYDLNLSGNNFISLPESIIQLPKLFTLNLEYCRSLRSISSLPSSIGEVYAHGCESLESYRLPPSVDSPDHRHFDFSECHKLDMEQRNSISNELLESQLQKIGQIIIGGSDIPHWFKHKSEGESISVCLPVGDYNNVKGIVICAAFECDGINIPSIYFYLKVNGYTVRHPKVYNPNGYNPNDHIVLSQITEYEEDATKYESDEDATTESESDVGATEYESDEGATEYESDEDATKYESDEADGRSRSPIKNLMKLMEGQHQDGCYIEASIAFGLANPDFRGGRVKVKKMGIHLVMEEEEQAETTSEQEGKQEKRPCSAQHNLRGFFDGLVSRVKCLLYHESDNEETESSQN